MRSVRRRQAVVHALPDSSLERVWDEHGGAVYALACAVLGDEAAAALAVRRGMQDLAGSTYGGSSRDVRRTLAQLVHARCEELVGDAPVAPHLPSAMVWVARLAPLQRACLALCCFGGHTHREAAALLGVPPVTVAELLTAALREVADFPVAVAPRSATSA